MSIQEEDFARLQEQILELKEENITLTEKSTKNTSELEDLKTENASLQKQLEKAQNTIAKSKKKKDVAELVAENEALKSQQAEENDGLHEPTAMEVVLREEATRLQSRIKELEDDQRHGVGVVSDKEAIERAVAEVADKKDQELRDRDAEHKVQIGILETEMDKMRSEFEEHMQLNAEERDQLEEKIERSRAKSEKRIKKREVELRRKDERIAELELEVQKSQQISGEQIQKAKETTHASKALEEAAENKITALRADIAALRKELDDEKSARKEEREALQSSIGTSAHETAEIESEMRQLREDLSKKDAAIAKAEKKQKKAESKLAKVEQKVADAETGASEAGAKYKALQGEFESSEKKFEKQLADQETESKKTIADLRKQLEAAVLAKKEADIRVMEERREGDHRVKQHVDEVNQEKAELQTSIEDMRKELEETKESLSQTEALVSARDSEVSSLKTELEAHTDRESSVKEECDSLVKEKQVLVDEAEAKIEELKAKVVAGEQELADKELEHKIADKKTQHMWKELKGQLQREIASRERAENALRSGSTRGVDLDQAGPSRGSLARDQSSDSLHIDTHSEASYDATAISDECMQLATRLGETQEAKWQLDERVRALEAMVLQLSEENEKKSDLLQHYVAREKSGQLTTMAMEQDKQTRAKKGGIMGGMFSSQFKLSPLKSRQKKVAADAVSKMEAVLEDTLLQNIRLQQDLETMGEEVGRLLKENKRLRGEDVVEDEV